MSVLSGLSLAIPFLNYHLGWLSLVCAIPLIHLLEILRKSKAGTARFVFYVWLSGLVMSLICFIWVAQINTDFIAGGLGGNLLVIGALLHFAIAGLACSLGFVPLGYLYKKMRWSVDSDWILLFFPAAWIICEWVRGVAFSAAMLGPNTVIGSNWELQNLGTAISVTPFGFSGRLLGMYGLGFLVILINLSVYRAIFMRRRKEFAAIALSAALLSAVFFLLYRVPDGNRISAGALQIGTDKKTLSNTDVVTGTGNLFEGSQRFDLLVLPEHSEVFKGDTAEKTSQILANSVRSPDSTIVTSRERRVDSSKYNTLTAYNQEGVIKYQRDKQLLIPVGESVPYLYRYFYSMLGKTDEVSMLSGNRETVRGKEPLEAFSAGNISLGAAACSAAMKPSLFRVQVSGGAEILSNSASVTMLEDAPTFHQQSLQITRFVSVSNARPMVQSTKGGYSLIMDNNGRLLEKSSRSESSLLAAEISTNQKVTPYSKLGEWVLYLSMAILAVAGALKFNNRRKR